MQLYLRSLITGLAAWSVISSLGHAQTIVNGSFSDGSTVPTAWEAGADEGKAAISRDTQVFASAPAALRISASGGGRAVAKCTQAVKVEGGRSYRFRGRLKTDNAVYAGLTLVTFAPAGKQTGWHEAAVVMGTQGWSGFDTVVTMPPTSETAIVMCYAQLEGNGTLWIDDVSMEAAPDTGPISVVDFRGNTLRQALDTWTGKVVVSDDGVTLQATGRGRLTTERAFDLSKRATYTPVMEIKALPGNTVTELRLTLNTTAGERVFTYKVPPATGNFVGVLPEGNATIARPTSGNASGAPGMSTHVTLAGNGKESEKLAVTVRRVELVPPGQKLTALPGGGAPAGGGAAKSGAETPLVVLQGLSIGGYGTWEQRLATGAEGIRVQGIAPAGGIAVGKKADLRPMKDSVPVVVAKTLPGNQARVVRLLLVDESRVSSEYDCEVQESADFTVFRPRAGITLTAPNKRGGSGGADLGRIAEVHVQGDYGSSAPMAMVVRGVYLQSAGGAATAGNADTPEVVVIDETSGAPATAAPSGPAKGSIVQSTTGTPPVLKSFSVESADLIALELEAQSVQVQGAVRYVPESDDTLEDIEDIPGFQMVSRNGAEIGILDTAAKMLYQGDKIEGISLTPEQINGTAFQLVSTDDRNYADAVPLQVSGIKARPSGFAMPAMSPTMRYSVYLSLPKPLVVDRNYELTAPGLLAKSEKLRYNAAKQTVQSLHISQGGFRPDDPAKIARLSLWLGTGGRLQAKPGKFQVLEDGSGKGVVDGVIQSFYPADRPDSLTPGRSLTQADVFVLDFSTLKTPGRYRVYVPELGNSVPFEVQPGVWEKAFATVMHSFYAQRSGIDIGSPYAQFRRPRTFHTLEGTRVRVAGFSLTQTNLAPGGAGEDFRAMAAKDKPGITIADANGGYFENGVSTVRRIEHLDASRQLLELMVMYPQYFTRLALAIPEAGRKEADLVDEVLWNLDFYGRLQLAEGGVCGAVVDPVAEMQYPVPPAYGKELLALAPDAYSSYIYAATAARAAVVLRSNPTQAQRLGQSAMKAFEWAERQSPPSQANRALVNEMRDRRNLAAAELLRLTGDERYRTVFGLTTCLRTSSSAYKPGEDGFDQREAVFTYARLPEASVDLQLRQAAVATLKADADQAVAIAAGNAWGLCGEGGSAMFYSTRATQSLLHAHYVLKNEAYLKTAITHASFVLGGNPANTSFVTGLGTQSVRNPVHPYTRLTKQPLPMGLVLGGVVDPRRPGLIDNATIKEAVAPLMQPSLEQWPAAECLLDVYIARPACDYSVQETLGPTAYLLGYLAGR